MHDPRFVIFLNGGPRSACLTGDFHGALIVQAAGPIGFRTLPRLPEFLGRRTTISIGWKSRDR